MSKDIRSYFQSKSKPKEKQITQVGLIDDDDVIPESPDVQIKLKKKESRKKRVIDDSSDEEIFRNKKKKLSNDKNKTPGKEKDKKNEKDPLKEVKVADMFGSGPIKRTEPLIRKKKVKTEIGIDDDDDFERSLLEIDEPINDCKKDTKFIESPVKIDKSVICEDNSKKINGDPKKSPVKSQSEVKEFIHNEHKETENKVQKLEKYKIPKKSSVSEKKIQSNEKLNSISPIKKYDKLSKVKNYKKRDFSEFVEGEQEKSNEDVEQKSNLKKKKLNTSLNSSVISDEERYEKKRHSAILYQNYLNRTGPKNLGAKELPEGSPDCLKDCAFLLTGVLESFERDEIAEAITKYGGTVKSGISRKVTHVLAGDDAGPAKLAKAEELGIKIIKEDDFLKMIVDLSKKLEQHKKEKPKDKISNDKTPNKKESDKSKNDKREATKTKSNKVSPDQMKSFEDKIRKNFYSKSKEKITLVESSPENHDKHNHKVTPEPISENVETVLTSNCSGSDSIQRYITPVPDVNSIMWVERYKPQNIKQIIGQHGDASNVKKLINWLTKWYINRKEKIPKPNPWAKNDDGAYYKAALLSGPPGVGKTTTVSLVCKELGFDMVEFNASDTRNKALIKEQIGELLTTTSLSGYARGATGKKAVSKKHVLVMDEVDGMAGNEDRGGLQELISLIKITNVPIICMCNDRNSEKMRTLVNYCYDLKFQRPRVDQIKSAMLSICCKERIKIPAEALTQLIIASNQDVRQTLNSLSMWAIDPTMFDSEKLKEDASSKKKDLKLGPWEAVRKVFSAEDHKTMSINDKSDLFFYDYSIAPLFVQENYLNVVPHCPKHDILERISQAADSISCGDLLEARIRGSQAWSLLPMQAMFSSVIPGTAMSGHVGAQIQFPGWLGKNSRANKMKRLAQEIHAHTRLSTTGSKSSIFLDYATQLRDAIVTPLIKDKMDGIERSIQVLNSYHLLREDLDSLSELAIWPGHRDPMILVDSKVKAAMTRTYNKQAPALPHATSSFSKSRKNRADDDYENDDEETIDGDSEPENDAMIKVKKKTAPKVKEEKPSTSKGEKGKKGKSKK